MVYGVSRIALPNINWPDSARDQRDGPLPTADFFAGIENQLAVPALEELLSKSGPAEPASNESALFNPLVLVGPTGYGKSHLARGITRHWCTIVGESAAEYLTAIDFARQLRAARDEGTLEQRRDQLANLQLLVVEDLQRLPLNTFVQRELRDTLDMLLDAGAAIVVTTQQPPATMDGLDAGLRDRLALGLTVRLQAPGIETRQELLRVAAAERGLAIDPVQIQQLAQKVEGPAPQLFRALAEWTLAISHTKPGSATDEIGDRPALNFKQILAVVARYFSLTQAALCSPARRKSLVYARGVAIHLARSLTDLSYAQIGQHLGRRDHTTVMHASRSIGDRLASDATTQQDVEELKRILTAV